MSGHPTSIKDDLEPIPDSDEVMANWQVWKERIADSFQNGMVSDFESGSEGEIGGIEERVASTIRVHIDTCCRMRSASVNKDV